jgi:hypothetical protein
MTEHDECWRWRAEGSVDVRALRVDAEGEDKMICQADRNSGEITVRDTARPADWTLKEARFLAGYTRPTHPVRR